MSTQQELQTIYDVQGSLTPALVVDTAKDPEHPLHTRFDWDDTTAAEKYRLVQAAYIIRSVRVTVQRSDSSTVTVRPWVARESMELSKLTDGPPIAGEYIPIVDVIADDVSRTAWFRSLERDWRSLKRRAGNSKEFASLVLDDVRSIAS